MDLLNVTTCVSVVSVLDTDTCWAVTRHTLVNSPARLNSLMDMLHHLYEFAVVTFIWIFSNDRSILLYLSVVHGLLYFSVVNLTMK